ncbi:MAG: ATP-binding cassette domain-containing protein [Candidatus Omnitrophica bacterium]|nr:ATP-binding cassette domain-containing protein [Candidatus Omnitrophota bacterium]
MIEVNGLTKYYGKVKAIDNISFKVEKGEILGFLGPNAAGKTTTMRIITCFIPATGGDAKVAGYDVSRDSLEVRRRIGYVPENVPLYDDMRVKEYLLYRAKLKEIPGRERKKRLSQIIEKCWIGDVQNRIVGQLSKGYRQRVGLAGAMIHNPPILILDEPTVGLDPNQIRQVRKLIKELGGEHTILLSTHILPEVEMVCGRVIIIDNGRLVAIDTPQGLTHRLKGGTRIAIEVRGEGKKIKDEIERIKGVASVKWHEDNQISNYEVELDKNKDLREEISLAITKNGGIIREMKRETMTLEDIFVHITTKEKEVNE